MIKVKLSRILNEQGEDKNPFLENFKKGQAGLIRLTIVAMMEQADSFETLEVMELRSFINDEIIEDCESLSEKTKTSITNLIHKTFETTLWRNFIVPMVESGELEMVDELEYKFRISEAGIQKLMQ